MIHSAEFVFWLASAWVVWTLALYPALAVCIGTVASRRQSTAKPRADLRVSIIISAYNEEKAIGDKLRQTLQLDYPSDCLEVIVASDGSTDGTDAIVADHPDPRVRLFRTEGRVGKTETLNRAVGIATGDIVVFSDATGVYARDALLALVSRFADPKVGCVAGRVVYTYGVDTNSAGFRSYQRWAVALRQAENACGNQTSASGSIHAIRRELYLPGDPSASMDVLDPVHAVAQGRRAVYEYTAVSIERSRTRLSDEFEARIRMSVRNTSMAGSIIRELVHARCWMYLLQMVSHKMMRWWLWAPLLAAFASAWMLADAAPIYRAAAALQTIAYAIACLGMISSRDHFGSRLAAMLAFFLVTNVAMAIGTLRALAGARRPAWEPRREPMSPAGVEPGAGPSHPRVPSPASSIPLAP